MSNFLIRKFCIAELNTHWEWVCSFCTGEHSQQLRIYCIATMGKVHGHFAFLCVQFIFHSALLVLLCAHLGPLQYWLASAKHASARRSTCYCFSHGWNNYAPSPQYAATNALQLNSKSEASNYCGQHWDRTALIETFSVQQTLYHVSHVSYAYAKSFQLWTR